MDASFLFSKKQTGRSPSLPLWISLLLSGEFLLDTSFLTSESAEVVELGSAHLTHLVEFDALDVRRVEWEDTLYTHCSRHLTYGEPFLVSFSTNLDDNTAIGLDTLLRTLDDFVVHGDGVTCLEIGEIFAVAICEGFLSNFDQIHCLNLFLLIVIRQNEAYSAISFLAAASLRRCKISVFFSNNQKNVQKKVLVRYKKTFL